MTETTTPAGDLSPFEAFLVENWNRRRGSERHRETDPRAEYWRQRFLMATGLAGELGEALELLKKHASGGDLDEHQLALELGDVLVYLTRLALAHGFTLADLQTLVMGKLKRRNVHGKDHAAERDPAELHCWAQYGHLVDGAPQVRPDGGGAVAWLCRFGDDEGVTSDPQTAAYWRDRGWPVTPAPDDVARLVADGWPDDVAFVATVHPDWTVMQLRAESFGFNRETGKVYKLPHPDCPFVEYGPAVVDGRK